MMPLDSKNGISFYEQIYMYYRSMILEGYCEPGFRLPSIRSLASDLCVSKNTVIMAYDKLMSEGYVANKQRSGFIVEDIGIDALVNVDMSQVQVLCSIKERQAQSPSAAQVEDAIPCEVDFKYGALDSRTFPLNTWRRIANTVLLSDEAARMMSVYGDPQGELPLRKEICKYLHRSRGVNCVPDQVVIESESQTAVMKLLLLFDKNKHTIAIDDPVYDGLSDAAENLGYELRPIPVSAAAEEGAYLAALEKASPKLIFTIPSHQFPTGAIMPLTTRIQLITWAVQNDAYILEDDYDSEYRYHSHPISSLQSIDKWQRVIYMGTFSKSLSPSLRLSYLVLPPKLLDRHRRQLNSHYCSVPWLEQEIVTRFMNQGLWDRHLRRVVTATRKKHDLLVCTLEERFGDDFEISGQNGGVHLWLRSKKGVRQKDLIERAAQRGARVYSDDRYWSKPDETMNGVLLGYHSLSTEDIERGIDLLGQAWL